MLNQFTHFIRHTVWISLFRSFPCQRCQVFCDGESVGDDFLRVLIAQFVQRKVAAIRDFNSRSKQVLTVAKQLQQLAGRFQIPLAIWMKLVTELLKILAAADGCEHIMQGSASRFVVVGVVGCGDRQVDSLA